MKSEANLSKELIRLQRENSLLKDENFLLEKRVCAKRYKIIDAVVDSLYGIRKKKILNLKKEIREIEQDKNMVKRSIKIGRVDIVNFNFYDWDGKKVFKGGAERYVYDLACLMKNMGLKPRIVQCSNNFFKKRFNGIEVIGIGNCSRSSTAENSAMLNYFCRDCEFVVASPLELACEIRDIPVIGINHGVNFDGSWNKFGNNYAGVHDERMAALKNVFSCICVDTNFINWTRTLDYSLSLKEKYIPNYFDENNFKVRKTRRKDDQVVFVYPRRIYEARGYDITIDAFRHILAKYNKKVKLNFVGQIDNEKAGDDLKKIMNDFPENVFHSEYKMEEMSNAYKDADVVLIPTKYCEGTSLSCIEGMASGAVVLVTNVGGLPNLVIDGYNGLVIEPTAEDLKVAIEKLINDSRLRKKLAENGKKVVKEAFNKKIWEKRWRCEIDKIRQKTTESV